MQVFHDLSEVEKNFQNGWVVMGNFDGVHLGHQALIQNAAKGAKEKKIPLVLLTFHPHPIEILAPQKKQQRILPMEERLSFFQNLGVDAVIVQNFTLSFATTSPILFFEKYLKTQLQANTIHVGANFSFGKNREGNIETLKTLCQAANIELKIENFFSIQAERVSSTRIRKTLLEGKLEEANTLLGYPFFIRGVVEFGDRRGNTKLGVSTANLRLAENQILPKIGVYVTQVVWQRESFRAATNVGFRPTFIQNETTSPIVEVHILDFDSQLYDEVLVVQFLARIRDEKKFDSIQALKEQIEKDLIFTRNFKN